MIVLLAFLMVGELAFIDVVHYRREPMDSRNFWRGWFCWTAAAAIVAILCFGYGLKAWPFVLAG